MRGTLPVRSDRDLAAAACEPAAPLWPDRSDRTDALMAAARVLAEADGETLSSLRSAALAIKRGCPQAARAILEGGRTRDAD